MSEKQRELIRGRAVVLAGVAAGALLAACDMPVPTELQDAIEEVSAVQADEGRDGSPSEETGSSRVARWFASDSAPLVVLDGVPVRRYEDLPEPVQRWWACGGDAKWRSCLRQEGVLGAVDRLEVLKGTRIARILYGEDAPGVIQLFTRKRSAERTGPGIRPGEGSTEAR